MEAFSFKLRRRTKSALRPVAMPLIRRLRLPFEVILPRIEQLQAQVNTLPRHDELNEQLAALENRALGGARAVAAEATESLRANFSNLTRAWMRQQHELARLSELADAHKCEYEQRLEQSKAAACSAQTKAVEVERQLHEDIDGRGARVDDTLRYLLERVEFVRRELMFELRYGGGSAGAPSARTSHTLEPRILAADKISAAREAKEMRVNLGCGHITAPGYINVDMRNLPGVDVVAEVGNLPFEPDSLDEISSTHLLEHFPQEELRRRLLPYWRGLLKPRGLFRAVTPDGAAMLTHAADGSYAFSDFREVLFGSQDYEGDFHFNLLTPHSLRELVQDAGFVDVDIPAQGRRNGQCFEFELTANAPGASAS